MCSPPGHVSDVTEVPLECGCHGRRRALPVLVHDEVNERIFLFYNVRNFWPEHLPLHHNYIPGLRKEFEVVALKIDRPPVKCHLDIQGISHFAMKKDFFQPIVKIYLVTDLISLTHLDSF